MLIDVNGYRTRVVDHSSSHAPSNEEAESREEADSNEEADAPVVLVHGTPFDLTCWDYLVPLLVHRRVVRYDARGHGGASGVPIPGFAVLAADLIAVLDRLDIGRAQLVGHSWGGQIVQRAALDHPDRVTCVSLLCTRSSPFPAFAGLAAAARVGQSDPTDSLARWFTADELADPDPLVEAVTATLRRADRQAWADALQLIADFDVLDELSKLTVGVRLVAGERDQVATVQHMAEMARALPRSVLQVVTGVGHLAPLQRPRAVADAIGTGQLPLS